MQDNTVKIGAVGDVFLCRGIEKICQLQGYDYPFRQVADVMRAYDITFANLENPVSTRGVAAKKNAWVTFRAKPESLQALHYAGINIVSLANNHMNDYGEDALLDTLAILRENGILYVGAGETQEQAHKHEIMEKNGTSVAFLAYHHLFGEAIRPAIAGTPGVAHMVKHRCLADIKKAKAQSDIVMVSIHWGIDYYDYPSPYYIKLAREFVDAGCDVILGHHAHVLQGYEEYNNGLIFYGLGNFIFDDPNPTTRLTAILDITIKNKKVDAYHFIPVFDDGSHQVRFAEGEMKQKILARIEGLSTEYKKDHWKGQFTKDPTDPLIWAGLKSFKCGGSVHHLRPFPLSTVLKRSLPLSLHKIKHHFFRS